MNEQEAFKQFKPMIYQIIHRQSCCGICSFDDREGVANLGFIKAYRNFDENKGKLSTVIYNTVRYELLNQCKKNRRNARMYHNDFIVTHASDNRSTFWESLWELSDDARMIVKTICEAPEEIVSLWLRAKSRRRILVFQYLHDLGWSIPQLSESFKEIGDEL